MEFDDPLYSLIILALYCWEEKNLAFINDVNSSIGLFLFLLVAVQIRIKFIIVTLII